MIQAEIAAARLRAICPKLQTELVPIVTSGDKLLHKPLVEFGGKGVFVTEFEEALLGGAIDAAVHSAKDLPMELRAGLTLAAVLERGPVQDVLVTVKGRQITRTPMLVGTGSPRRQVQIKRLRPVVCRQLRGNVDTRLEKLYAGEFDALILAAAGLERLGLAADERFVFEALPEAEFLPAGGQGVIALEAREDSRFASLFARANHEPTALFLRSEREVLRLLGAGCEEPVGVHARLEGEKLVIRLMQGTEKGVYYQATRGEQEQYLELAKGLARKARSVRGRPE